MVDAVPKVAIACQGGGTHAAFEAGVLSEILKDIHERNRFDLVGLSGTSAGALCALMVWYALAPKNGRPGSVRAAIDKLNRFWDAFAATTPQPGRDCCAACRATGARACCRGQSSQFGKLCYVRRDVFDDVAQFHDRVIAVDPARTLIVQSKRETIVAAVLAAAAKDHQGRLILDQP